MVRIQSLEFIQSIILGENQKIMQLDNEIGKVMATPILICKARENKSSGSLILFYS